MKVFLSAVLLLTSSLCFADESLQIKLLEERIKALEAQNGSTATSNGLKVKDLGGRKIQNQRIPSAETAPAMSAEQQAEIMEKLNQFKSRRQEEVKLLDQMDSEGY
ncbi:MAG: hypothetical protein ACJAT2_000010 [Bacteriovoracaceae bacterium]|jgi:hypothetical protein